MYIHINVCIYICISIYVHKYVGIHIYTYIINIDEYRIWWRTGAVGVIPINEEFCAIAPAEVSPGEQICYDF